MCLRSEGPLWPAATAPIRAVINGKAAKQLAPVVASRNAPKQNPMTEPKVTETRKAQCRPTHGRSGPRTIARTIIASKSLISVKPPEQSPVMNPSVMLTVSLITIGGTMATADHRTTVHALKLTAFYRAEHLTTDITDTHHPILVIYGVAKSAQTGLDHISAAGPVTLIVPLQVLLVEWVAVGFQFAAQCSYGGMPRPAAFSAKLTA